MFGAFAIALGLLGLRLFRRDMLVLYLQDGGLEHCFVHGGKAVEAVLYLIFIASNIRWVEAKV